MPLISMNPQPTLLEMPKFIPPTMEQVREQSEKMELPETEARKFFCYYESNGWKVGKNPMRRWIMALAGWQLRYQERSPAVPKSGESPLSPTQMTMFNQEYQRILKRIEVIHNGYDSHQDIRPADRIELSTLVKRKKELQKILGITI